jgi:hypothetical protein
VENGRDVAEELWEHHNDPDEWSEEAEDVETRPSGSAVVSFRIPWEELEELDEAATESGESLSAFIRQAVRLRLGGRSKVPVVVATFGGARDFELRTNIPEQLRGAEPSSVPDSDRDLLASTAP